MLSLEEFKSYIGISSNDDDELLLLMRISAPKSVITKRTVQKQSCT